MDKRELPLEDFLALQEKEDLEYSCAFFQLECQEGWTGKRMAQELAEDFRLGTDELFEVFPWEGLHFLSELFQKDCVLAGDPRESGYGAENEADFLDALEDLEDFGLVHVEEDPDTGEISRILTSYELKRIMDPLMTKEIMEDARVNDMMGSFVRGMLYYYGVVELHRLLRMVRAFFPGFPEDTFETLLNVRSNLRHYVHLEFVHDELYAFGEIEFDMFLDEEREMVELVDMVEGSPVVEYKTFSPAELFMASQEDYLENGEGLERLKSKLKPYFTYKPFVPREGFGLSAMGDEQLKDEELDQLLRAMVGAIRRSGDVDYALEGIARVTDFPSEKERKEVHDEFIFYVDNISWYALRGHTPNEMRNIRSDDHGKVLPFRKTRKVGRNDPCPCGSGKKYKNCHGKEKSPVD